MRRHIVIGIATTFAVMSGMSPSATSAAVPVLPSPDHVVIVVMENRSYADIISGNDAPFLQELGRRGALFVNSYAVEHPSEPNYFALLTGSTQNVHDDNYYAFDEPTLAGQLAHVNRTFLGYAESGSPRKHNPWESFKETRDLGRDFSRFPRDFTTLPTVSFVVPDNDDDMHDGSTRDGDTWLLRHLSAYADWCRDHNSLLIVTFDEDDNTNDNHIPTIIYGAHVKPGRYHDEINHFTILRTLQALYGLPPLARSADEQPITDIWTVD
jgi:acid phosphatase